MVLAVSDRSERIFQVKMSTDQRSLFQRQDFVYLRKFITPDRAKEFCQSLQHLPVRRVICGDSKVSWGQQDVPNGDPLYRFFTNGEGTTLVREFTDYGPERLREVVCWTSIYEFGEFINPHRDGSGDVQLLLCLCAAPQVNGGALLLHNKNLTRLQLASGDAVLFRATKITHQTTPLMRTQK